MLSRYASRELDRMVAGHELTVTEFQLLVTLWTEGPATTLGLARRLRLDPGPTGRSLRRLEQRGFVRRPFRWRFSEWALEPHAVLFLEVVELGWEEVNRALRAEFGAELVRALVRAVENLPEFVPREGQGWCWGE